MGSRKLIVTLQLILGSCSVLSQYVQNLQPCSYVSTVSSSPITPVGQFVIPAIIKPILQPEVPVQATAPAVPSFPGDYSGFGGFPGFPGFPGGYPAPFGGMPPIIFDDDDDRSNMWLYWLILALSRRGRFGGGFFGNDGYGNGCGNYGGCGGCNGGCGGGYCNCNYCCSGGGCGCGYGGGYNGGNGGYGCGGYGNNCGCGNGCTYIPYPIPVPCGSCSGGYPNFESSNDESYPNQGNQTPPEINVIIRSEQQQAPVITTT